MAKKKTKRNITGLRNQSKTVSHPHPVIHANLDEQSDNDEGWEVNIKLDSHKLCWELDEEDLDEEEASEDEDTDGEKGDVEDEVIEAGEAEWRNDGLHVKLMILAIEIGDDPRDEDWIPDDLRRKHLAKLAHARPRAKFYQKGPDVGSKAEQTRCRYRHVLKGQQTLESLGFTQAEPQSDSSPYPSSPTTTNSELLHQHTKTSLQEEATKIKIKVEDNSPPISPSANYIPLPLEDGVHVWQETPDAPVLKFNVQIRQESLTLPPLHFDESRSLSVRICQESVTPLPLFFDRPAQKRKASGDLESDDSDEEPVHSRGESREGQRRVESDVHKTEDEEAWEEELDETLTPNAKIQDWEAL